MRFLGIILLSLLSLVMGTLPAGLSARETDQYQVWTVELSDSSPLINEYLEKHLEAILSAKNMQQKSCQDLSLKFFKRLVGTFTFSQFSLWAQNGKEMQSYRFPPKGTSKSQYVKESIFAGKGASPIIKWVIGLAPTININGIYLGTDKLGHISYMGYKYYKKYLKLMKKGLDENQALNKVLADGLKSETLLGGFYGTSSPSDLEANYQGLQFAIDLCASQNPLLTKTDGKWAVDKVRFKIQNYVTPEFDESFYPLIFGKLTWKNSAREKIQKICAEKDLTMVKKRFEDYRTRFKPSRNISLVSAKMKLDAKFNNTKFNYQNACGLDF